MSQRKVSDHESKTGYKVIQVCDCTGCSRCWIRTYANFDNFKRLLGPDGRRVRCEAEVQPIAKWASQGSGRRKKAYIDAAIRQTSARSGHDLCIPCAYNSPVFEAAKPHERKNLVSEQNAGSALSARRDVAAQLSKGVHPWAVFRPSARTSEASSNPFPALATSSYDWWNGQGRPIRISEDAAPVPVPKNLGHAPSLHYPGLKRAQRPEWDSEYRAHLDEVGLATIYGELYRLKEFSDQVLTLLCFCEVAAKPAVGGEREGKSLCHRREFAKWWEEQTRLEVPELPENRGMPRGAAFHGIGWPPRS